MIEGIFRMLFVGILFIQPIHSNGRGKNDPLYTIRLHHSQRILHPTDIHFIIKRKRRCIIPMLRRQQAEAVIAARKKIVEGAVTMVEMAVDELGQHGKIELDEERKAQMASNLMVVLCGESEAKPIVNTGSLY